MRSELRTLPVSNNKTQLYDADEHPETAIFLRIFLVVKAEDKTNTFKSGFVAVAGGNKRHMLRDFQLPWTTSRITTIRPSQSLLEYLVIACMTR